MIHSHNFPSWPFPDAVNTAVFTTRQILESQFPIVEVYHDHDGDWQFLCGTTTEAKDLKLVCLGCMLERDLTLAKLADMPFGWCATRENSKSEWSKEKYESGDEENA